MIKQLACVFALTAGAVTQAHAEQGCPYPSSIKYVDGYFQASAGQAFWQSPKSQIRDFIDAFVGAVFTPGQGQERENGYLDKCIYRTGGGQVVALRYGIKSDVDTMSLTSTLHWQLASDPFGQDVYICQDSQPDNCAFTTRDSRM